jgi:hypothetical protein
MKAWTIPKSSSAVKVLRLKFCFFHSTVLSQILDSVKAVQILDFTLASAEKDRTDSRASQKDTMLHCTDFRWSELINALYRHRQSLSGLILQDAPVPRHKGRILKSLTDFANLEFVGLHLDMLIDLAAGEIDIARKLPGGMRALILQVNAEDEFRDLQGPAIASLNQGNVAKAMKQLVIIAQPCLVGLGRLNLSGPLETLSRAGIQTRVSGASGLKFDGYRDNWTVAELRDLERRTTFLLIPELIGVSYAL